MGLSARAGVIAGVYGAVAGAYIVLSGRLARAMASSVEELERLERFKGIAFVAVTALGLFLVAYLVLRKQQADADDASRARETLLKSERNALAGLFVSSIAHDANNVTMVVSSTLDLLQDEQGLSPDNRESLRDAREAMDTLTRLFKDLKEMGRDRSTARVPMELGFMVKRITSLLRGHSALKHCQVVLDAPAPVTLPVFPVLIDQVLINLLLNAADATEGRGHLEVRVRATGDEARLEVHDDGKGLPEGMQAALFKPFASSKPHGTGLGLVSVRECALAHGGRVEYARSPLGGAAFSVVLPLPSTGG
ncbi:MAG: HAMP domain-containing sensor histidine kinase [Archangium sp.]|nr:HAMP domain-containing sensor histidine kinase [Archangium sp.]